MKLLLGHGANASRVVVSLCDYSGNWPKPWHDAGYTVALFDLKHGDDVTDTARVLGLVGSSHVDVVLAAPPCTDFTVSGARWWAAKDADGRTEQSLRVLDACLHIATALSPRVFALENPVGRIAKLRPVLGQPRFYFNPCDFALLADDPESEAYTKRTGIWGRCNRPAVGGSRLEPVMYTTKDGKRGSWMWAKLGGKSERTKELRSNTPRGFARAFYDANKD